MNFIYNINRQNTSKTYSSYTGTLNQQNTEHECHCIRATMNRTSDLPTDASTTVLYMLYLIIFWVYIFIFYCYFHILPYFHFICIVIKCDQIWSHVNMWQWKMLSFQMVVAQRLIFELYTKKILLITYFIGNHFFKFC